MSLVAVARRQYAKLCCQRCHREGCELKAGTGGRIDYVFLDCDKYKATSAGAPNECGESGKMADCIFVGNHEGGSLVVAELKSGAADVHRAVKQIQCGLKLAEHLFKDCTVAICVPALLCGRGPRDLEMRVLRRRKVGFRGKHRLVVYKRCGASVREIFAKYAENYRADA